MSGANYCQLFETAVYHMPSKSVRMREDQKVNFDNQYNKSIRNFIRKWGIHPESIWDNSTIWRYSKHSEFLGHPWNALKSIRSYIKCV